MLDAQAVILMHAHGDERVPMTERRSHSPAANDPERGWLRGRIFRCTRCEDEVIVLRPGEDVHAETPG
jgi:hypothetical protein